MICGTDADVTAAYWGHRNESDWQPGSTWRHVRTDGSGISDVTGTVVEAVRPERLVMTFPGSAEQREDPSLVTFTIEDGVPITRTSRAEIRYLNIVGDRYLALQQDESGSSRMPEGSTYFRAWVKSSSVTSSLSSVSGEISSSALIDGSTRRSACIAASLTRSAMSAPTNPCVSRATASRSTSGPSFLPFA